MTMIIKRSGDEELFNPGKIKRVLAITSDEAEQPLSESDLNNIAGEVSRILADKPKAYSRDIFIIVTGILYIRGLHKILEYYTGFEKNFWKSEF